MIDVYTTPGTAGTIAHLAVELAGAEHRRILVTVADDGSVDPAGYRDLNPSATVPTIVDGDVVLYETVAILEHLADRFGGTDVAPAAGTPERVRYHFWLGWLTNNLMGSFYRWFKARKMIAPDHVEALKAGAVASVQADGAWLEQALAGRDWLVGDRISAADVFLSELVGWASEIDGLVVGGANVAAHRARTLAHPTVAAALAHDAD